MASPSMSEVQERIDAAIRIQEDKFGRILGQYTSVEQAETMITGLVAEAKQEFANQSTRINEMIIGSNTQFETHKQAILAIVSDFEQTSTAIGSSTELARMETKGLSDELVRLRGELVAEFALRTESLAAARKEMSDWADQHKVTVMTMLQQQGGGGGWTDQGKGQGQGQAQGGKGPSIDRKEVSVWKLPDHVSKQEFRHWLDAVDTYLSAAQNFEFPEVVLDRVRRHPDEVNQSNWATVMANANAEVPRNKKIDEWTSSGKSGDFMGVPGADPWKIDLAPSWEFVSTSRYLYTFLCNKINTELHGRTIGIEDRNGLELYRQIVQSVDAIPDNAKFLMGADIGNLVHKHGDKVKDLKSLFGFRGLLKKRAAEYKKVIGEEVDPDKLKELLWNAMDPGSKMIATQTMVHRGTYKLIGSTSTSVTE